MESITELKMLPYTCGSDELRYLHSQRMALSCPFLSTLLLSLLVPKVVGHKKGLDVMERADPLFLLMGLPTIPVMLVLGKMIRWEDYIVRLWQKHSTKLQLLSGILPGTA